MRLTHAHAIEKREKDVTQYPICIISYKSSFYNDVIVCIPGYSVLVIMSYVMWLTIVSVAVSVSVTVRLRNNIGQRLPPWTGNLPRYTYNCCSRSHHHADVKVGDSALMVITSDFSPGEDTVTTTEPEAVSSVRVDCTTPRTSPWYAGRDSERSDT